MKSYGTAAEGRQIYTRYNPLFCLDNGEGLRAGASAAIYGLIETAGANGPEPYQYLRYLSEDLRQAKTTRDGLI